VFEVLTVCTGNICRSPLAERYTAHRLEQVAADLAPRVHAASAGVRGLEGYPMDGRARDQLERHGGRADGFLARRLTSRDVEQADLVLTMTRTQRGEALEAAPPALPRIFTLLEGADLARLAVADDQLVAGPVELVAAMSARRGQARLADDDVTDPIGASRAVHARVADVITAAVDQLVEALVPSLRRPTPSGEPAG